MTWIAEAIGACLGAMIKSMGAAGVEALVRGLSNALVEKQVVSKPNSDLDAEWANGLRNNGDRPANGK